MDTSKPLPKKNIRKLINVVSIVIPVVVAALFGVNLRFMHQSMESQLFYWS
jgi:hypothetical protein